VLAPISTFSFDANGTLLLDGLSRWYGCNLTTAYGYKESVAWKLGKGKADVKGCKKLTITKA
jgi:hypothetical protein